MEVSHVSTSKLFRLGTCVSLLGRDFSKAQGSWFFITLGVHDSCLFSFNGAQHLLLCEAYLVVDVAPHLAARFSNALGLEFVK